MENKLKSFRDGAVVLYKRGRSNKWQARVKIGKGKNSWKRFATGEHDPKTASEIACDKYDEMKFKVKNGLPAETRQFKKVAELAKEELQQELDDGYGKIIYSDYIQAINKYMIPFFFNKHIDCIDHKVLLEFDKYRAEVLGRLPAKSTISTHNSALKRVFGIAVRNKWVSEYQVPALVNNGDKNQVNRRPYFGREEYRVLRQQLAKFSNTGRKQLTKDLRTLLRDYVLIIVNTGMRPGTETDSLKWNDISEFQGNDGVKYIKMIVSGKTGERELIARDNVKSFLKRIALCFEELKDLKYEDLIKRNELVFRLRNGDKPKRSSLNDSFKQCLDQCGLLYNSKDSKRTLYSLRHTYATFELLKGRSIHILAKQMGTSVLMLERHYSHLIPSMSAEELSGQYHSNKKGLE